MASLKSKKLLTQNIPLLIHIAYGAILGETFPWINLEESTLSIIFSLTLLLLYINSWITNQIIIQRYPYFDTHILHDTIKINAEFVRLIFEFFSIAMLGLAILAIRDIDFKINPIYLLLAYFIINTFWSLITKYQFNYVVLESNRGKDKNNELLKTFMTIIVISSIVAHIIFPPVKLEVVITILLLKIIIDIFASSSLLYKKPKIT